MEDYNIFNAKYIINSGGLIDVTTQLQNQGLCSNVNIYSRLLESS